MLGKDFGHKIPNSQMHYNAAYKEIELEDQYIEETVLDNVEKIKYVSWHNHYQRLEMEHTCQNERTNIYFITLRSVQTYEEIHWNSNISKVDLATAGPAGTH